jgi:hypothetical protein
MTAEEMEGVEQEGEQSQESGEGEREEEGEEEDYVCELCGSSVVPNGAMMLKCSTDNCMRGRHTHCMTPQMSVKTATKATLQFTCALCTRDKRLANSSSPDSAAQPAKSVGKDQEQGLASASSSGSEGGGISGSDSDEEQAPVKPPRREKQKPSRGRGRGGVGSGGARDDGAGPSSPRAGTVPATAQGASKGGKVATGSSVLRQQPKQGPSGSASQARGSQLLQSAQVGCGC